MKTTGLMLALSAVCGGGYLGVQGALDEPHPGRAEQVSVEASSLAAWQREFQTRRNRQFSQAEHRALLASVRTLSSHFDERLPLTSDRDAVAVLLPERSDQAAARLDARLLGLWLNIANGAVVLDDPVDADGDGTDETTVAALLQGAADARDASAPRRTVLRTYAGLLDQVSTRH